MSRHKNGGRPPAKDMPRVKRDGGTTWLQVVEAADRLGVTPGRIYHLIVARRLSTRLFECLTYVKEQDVRLYQILRREHQRAQATSPTG